MDTTKRFKIGDYLVEPELDRISLNGAVTSVRPQVMELLVYLARRPGRVFAAHELIAELWPGKVVTQASLYNCVAELRRALGANGDQTSLIETIPKRGYRLVGEVSGLEPRRVGAGRRESRDIPRKRPAVGRASALVLVVLVAAFFSVYQGSDDETPTPIQRGNSEPFIAVLPFKDLSPRGNQAYFAEGMAEELINSLAQIKELQVAARSTSFALADVGLVGTDLTDRLKLTHLLEGSVRKDGDRVRITAQLIDARSSAHLWSSSYDRNLDDAFAVQREISNQVVRELKIRVAEEARAIASPDPQALEWVLEGRYLVAQRSLDRLKRAESLFTQAIDVDPDYADAYAGLAKSLVLTEGLYQWGDSQLLVRARAALGRALTLDPRNSDALASSGLMLWGTDTEAAQKFYERAIESNPSNSDAYRWLALSYEQTDPMLYLEHIRKAYLVDPLNHPLNFHRAMSLSRFGFHDEALAAVQNWRRLNPRAPGPYLLAGRIHFWRGAFDGALNSYYRAYRINPDWRAVATYISELFTELNQLRLADAWLRVGQGDEVSSNNENRRDMIQRTVLAALGDEKKAVSTLLSQIQEPDPYWSLDLGRALVLGIQDFGAARVAWERGLRGVGWNRLRDWGAPNLVDYSLVLERTGAHEKAMELADAAESLIENQSAAGMIHYGEWDSLQAGVRFYSAALEALRGDEQQTVAKLSALNSQGGELCLICLKTWTHFDLLRGDPEFEALLLQFERKRAAQSRNLADRKLLLTPDEVRALEEPDFESALLAAEK